MQSRELVFFQLPAAARTACSVMPVARILKNGPDFISSSSKLTHVLSAATAGAGMTPYFREQATDFKASAAAVALASLAPAVLKHAVAQMVQNFRSLADGALDVAADIGFIGLTVARIP